MSLEQNKQPILGAKRPPQDNLILVGDGNTLMGVQQGFMVVPGSIENVGRGEAARLAPSS